MFFQHTLNEIELFEHFIQRKRIENELPIKL